MLWASSGFQTLENNKTILAFGILIKPSHSFLEEYFKVCFGHLVLLEMISFEKVFKKVAQKFEIRRK